MRQRLHHGRGNRKPFSRWAVLPHGWDNMLRPIAEATMTARVTIRRPGVAGTNWDAVAEQTVASVYPPHFEGWARVQHAAGVGANTITADDPEPTHDYLVTVPADASEVAAGDVVTITLSGDPILDGGTPLYIAHVAAGSLLVERDLFCSLNPHTS